MKRSTLVCAVLTATACQTYAPVGTAAVPAGAMVQVSLTESGREHVVPEIGSRAEQLEGRASGMENGGLTITVSDITRAGGATELGENKVVHLGAGDISEVRVQRTSVVRSLALGGALVAGSIVAGRSLGGGSGSTLRGGGPIKTGQ